AFVGDGVEGNTRDGGQARAAAINPYDIAADSRGNVYIGSSLTIRKVAPDGTISLFAGGTSNSAPPFGDGGPAATAYLYPGRMAYYAAGDALYVADNYSSRVRKIDLTSTTISTVAGSGTAYYIDADFQGDNGPATAAKMNFGEGTGVAVTAQGDLY